MNWKVLLLYLVALLNVVVVVAIFIHQTTSSARLLQQREQTDQQREQLEQMDEQVKSLQRRIGPGPSPEAKRLEVIERLVRELEGQATRVSVAVDNLVARMKRGDAFSSAESSETTASGVLALTAQLEKLGEIVSSGTALFLTTRTLDQSLSASPQASDLEGIRSGMSMADVLTLLGYPYDVRPSENGTSWSWDVARPEGAPRPGVVFRDGVVVSTFD